MTKFIKLSNMVINIKHIIRIHTHLDTHYIYLNNVYFSGFSFMGSGALSTDQQYISLHKSKNEADHKIITEWINKINFNIK